MALLKPGMVLGFFLLVGFLIWKNLSVPVSTGLLDGRLKPCPNRPNCVCSQTADKEHYIAPLKYKGKDSLLKIREILQGQFRVYTHQLSSNYMHLAVLTPVMKFRDDLEFLVDEKEGVIHIRSAARLGWSDFGTNRKRIELIREKY